VRLFWAVDVKTDIVKLARFKSFGCGTAIASSDMMCELCLGKKVDEVLGINNLVVERALRDTPDKPAVPPQKMHCSVMAHDVLKLAVSLYKGVDVESLEDKEIVCSCARVTLGTIKQTIKLNDLTTVEQITQYTKAGGFCKSCIRPGGHEKKEYYLEDILRATRAEMENEKREKEAKERLASKPKNNFRLIPLIKRLNIVEDVLEAHVRPTLRGDGGDCEVLDLKDKDNDAIVVFIQYTGACADCASAKGSTHALIEETLKREIDDKITVTVVEGEEI